MKVRNGFVSNSSSSSFLISKPTSDYAIVVPSEKQNLPATRIDKIEDLFEFMTNQFCYWGEDKDEWMGNEDAVSVFMNAVKAIKDGNCLFYTTTDNYDELTNYWQNEEVLAINNMSIIYKGYC